MHIFQLAQELGLEVSALQDWLKERGHAAHGDPLARLDNRLVNEVRQAFPRKMMPLNLAVSGFSIEGFKAFGAAQEIPLAPITLIFGPNSSGKSSLLHSLLWAHHAATTGELDVVRPTLAGESVNLGGFDLVRFRRQGGAINLTFDIPADQSAGRLSIPGLLRLHLSFNRGSAFQASSEAWIEDLAMRSIGEVKPPGSPEEQRNAAPHLESLSLDLDARELMRASWRRNGRLRMDKVDFDHPFWRERIESAALGATFKPVLSEQDRKDALIRLEEALPTLTFAADGFFAGKIEREEPESEAGNPTDVLSIVVVEFVRILKWIVDSGVESSRHWLESLRYLGPLRTYPDRGWALSDQRDAHWLAGGGEAWDAIKTSREVRDYVNRFLINSGYSFQLLKYVEHDRAKDSAQRHVEEIMSDLGQSDPEGVISDPRDKPIDLFGTGAEILRDVVITDIRNSIPVSPRDIGVGISQVVPVLALAYGLKEKTILIEQPEIHVHPKLQADLGDVFLETALQPNLMRNRYIIETHSEHLILRILKRIRQTTAGEVESGRPPVRPEDVSVIYAEPSKTGTKLIRLTIDESGRFVDEWPGGFFAERLDEVF